MLQILRKQNKISLSKQHNKDNLIHRNERGIVSAEVRVVAFGNSIIRALFPFGTNVGCRISVAMRLRRSRRVYRIQDLLNLYN